MDTHGESPTSSTLVHRDYKLQTLHTACSAFLVATFMPKNSSVLVFYYILHKIYFIENKMRKIWLWNDVLAT